MMNHSPDFFTFPEKLETDRISGLVLAGGQGKRMGGANKACLILGGKPLWQHVFDRLIPEDSSESGRAQCSGIAITLDAFPPAEKDPRRPAFISDLRQGQPGPLAGIEAGLHWLAEQRTTGASTAEWLMVVSVDTPFFPQTLARDLFLTARSRLEQQPDGFPPRLIYPCSGGFPHLTLGLWHISLLNPLTRALDQEPEQSARQFARKPAHVMAIEYGSPVPDPFFNINRPEDLARAEDLAKLFSDKGSGPESLREPAPEL